MPFDQPLPAHLSPSRLQDFRACPRRYQLGAVERLPQPASYAATKGRLVHHALEHLYLLAPESRRDADVDALLDEAEAAILDDATRADLHLDEARAATLRVECRHSLETYLAMEDPALVEHEGVELRLSAEVDGVPLLGILDRVDREGEELVVVDYKTGAVPDRRFDSLTFANAELYAALLQATSGELPSRLRLLYLSKGSVLERHVTPVVVRARTEAAARAWGEITQHYQAGEFPATPSARTCRFCAYKARCRADGVSVPA